MKIYLECPYCKGDMVPMRKRTAEGRKQYQCVNCKKKLVEISTKERRKLGIT